MKKILATIAIAASMFAVNAQAQSKGAAAAKAAVDKAFAATEKQGTKVASWLKYGQTLVAAYEVATDNIFIGMSKQEFDMINTNLRPQSEGQVTVGEQSFTKLSYADRNLYFGADGNLAAVEVTRPVVENALDKALEAYKKAASVDTKGSKTKDITGGLEKVASKYTEEALSAYTLSNYKEASTLFEKAAAASATAPLNKQDVEMVYNAAFTAWMAQDLNRAKKLFEDCLANGYSGEGGEAYARLADISEKLGDKAATKKYLEEGFQKNPESQSILIGLINYYLSSGEDTNRLFSLFDEAKRNEPDNASLYYVEGNARGQLGQDKEAVAAYDKAIQVDPNYEWGYIGKGIQLYNMAIALQDKASEERDDNKYMALVGEFESTLKQCIEPFEKAFELTKDEDVKYSIAEYLKNTFFRFRNESADYQAKYEKYLAATQ